MNKLNVAASILFLLGLCTILLKGFTPEYVDSQGVLREWFFLLPIGFGTVFIALCLFLVSIIINIIKRIKGVNI
ncbi:DUF3955 domain-containing protein [Mammaliicoccus fleurettii]|uniref:DUF3955 domain-containing protein n=1 Tax=Mammaliicoccus fleurettii TaxID=150056 RepID=UPI002DBD5795|nr:DUF3955 domain-containing protein [Mammaliicoccus fleurettii]MEB7723882.1 DUF3955 domain-containing protein [Mammaliicoccus fleurettii]